MKQNLLYMTLKINLDDSLEFEEEENNYKEFIDTNNLDDSKSKNNKYINDNINIYAKFDGNLNSEIIRL